jgi:hypothetical protein
LPRRAVGTGSSSSVRIFHSPISTAMYDSASTVKHQPNPTVLMRMPASVGPTMRAPVMSALLRLTAFPMSSFGTISTTKLRRAGLSNAVVTPPISATP